ncbi:PH domain-containing protein [Ulvibacterium sp.]|uniref:PH domain-containing protein n=1 Tax=Ulvibacterium sp. TaxID=2665914 RepID=UPI003CC5B383
MVNAKEWIGLDIHFLILALVAYTFKSTHYIIYHKVLKIRCGFFFNKTIAIDTIYKISESHNPVSAPAASLDRLELF